METLTTMVTSLATVGDTSEKKREEETVEVYGERPCVAPFEGTIGRSIEGDVSIIGSYAWRQDRLAKIHEKSATVDSTDETTKEES